MQTSAVGNRLIRPANHHGFTLLELLVVIAIIALATLGVSLSLPDSSDTLLEREAQRLAAQLEAARAQSRALGVAVRWQPLEGGFRFDGLGPQGSQPRAWLDSGTQLVNARPLTLGPEPVIGAQSVELVSTLRPQRVLTVRTDGVHPFAVAP